MVKREMDETMELWKANPCFKSEGSPNSFSTGRTLISFRVNAMLLFVGILLV